MKTAAERIIATEPCATCGAKIGEKCKSETGRVFDFLHIARTENARSTGDGAKRKK